MGCKCTCKGASSNKGNKGDKGNQGLFGGYSQRWLFNDAVTSSPVTKTFRLNNADPSLATAIYVHKNNASSIDMSLFIASFINSSRYGMIRIFDETDSSKFAYYILTNVTLSGSVYTLTVTYVQYEGAFVLGNKTVISFTPAGQLVRTRAYTERSLSGGSAVTISNAAGNLNTEVSLLAATVPIPSNGTYRLMAALEYAKCTYATANAAGNLFMRIKVNGTIVAFGIISLNGVISNIEQSLAAFWEGTCVAADAIDVVVYMATIVTDETVVINTGKVRISYEKLD